MLESIQQDTVRLLFHVRVEQKVEREQVAKVTGTNKDESGPRKPVQRAERKIYPNDPWVVPAFLPEAACHTKYKTESR